MQKTILILLVFSLTGCARLGAGLSAAGNTQLPEYKQPVEVIGKNGQVIGHTRGGY